MRGTGVKRRMIRTEEYEVETFLQRMVVEKGGREQFLLKWVGYDETTWHPSKNLVQFLEKIGIFGKNL